MNAGEEGDFEFLGTYQVSMAWRLLDALREAGVEVASGPLAGPPGLDAADAARGGAYGANGTIDLYVHRDQFALAGEIDGMVFGTGGVDSREGGEFLPFPYLEGEDEDRTGEKHERAVWERKIQVLARQEAKELDQEIAAIREELGYEGVEPWRFEAMTKALRANQERRRQLLDGKTLPKNAPPKPSPASPLPPGQHARVSKSDRKLMLFLMFLLLLFLVIATWH